MLESLKEVPVAVEPGRVEIAVVGLDSIVWVAGMSRGVGKSGRPRGDGELESGDGSVDEPGDTGSTSVEGECREVPFIARLADDSPCSPSGGDTAIAGPVVPKSPISSASWRFVPFASVRERFAFGLEPLEILPCGVGTSEELAIL